MDNEIPIQTVSINILNCIYKNRNIKMPPSGYRSKTLLFVSFRFYDNEKATVVPATYYNIVCLPL